jgi:RNA polymerase sigma factor (sigma-70 family)
MASETATAQNGTDDLLGSLVSGQRGRSLRAQLTHHYPDLSPDTIEDAVQYACKSFLAEAEGITAPGQVYVWIRTAAHRSLSREVTHHKREVAVDPAEDGWRQSADEVGPVEELIDLEDDADMEMLVREVSSSLSDRRRDVLALYGAGYKRPQIADRLGVPERVVKRDLREIMDAARATLVRLAGGGCEHGEPLVMRLIFGISTPDESSAAREHLAHCERCELFSERLIGWREKAGAMLPAPVAEGAYPGVVRQVVDAAGEKISSLKQHVLEGGAQLKQQATATSSRAVDPTPLAGARPGTAVAVIAGCLAIGGGAAGVCVDQGIDPLDAAGGLIASSADDTAPEETTPAPEPESTGPTYAPVETPVEEEPAPAPEPSPQPAPEADPHPEPQPEPAEPENGFEPASSSSNQSTETESESSYEATEESSASSEPAPASPSPGVQQFQP